jgi:predicted site-specific integrase-resolvase
MADHAADESGGWMRPAHAARVWGINRATVWRWVEKGLVEAKRLDAGTGVRVRLKEGTRRADG